MKIYLSGPMRGKKDFNYPLFHEVATRLREDGHEVFNPAEAFNGDTSRPVPDYLRLDVGEIIRTRNLTRKVKRLSKRMKIAASGQNYYDCIAVLPGWEKSQGAQLETQVAKALGIPIRLASSLDLVNETILQEAQRLVHGDRQNDYGHPYHDFSRTAKLWAAILGVEVTPRQVALCMIQVKVSRECNRPKRDNRVDICGYTETLDMVDQYESQLARTA